MRIDPDLAANGWEGPAKIDGARVSREEMLWPGRIMSGGQTNAPKPADYVLRMNGHVMAVMEAKKATLADYMERLFAAPFATLSADQRAMVDSWTPDVMANAELAAVATLAESAE